MLRMFWRKEMNQETKNKALWIFENIRESVLYLPDSLQGKAWKIIIDYSFGDEKSLNCEKNKRVLQTFYAVKPLLRLRGIAGSQNGKSNNPSGLAKQPEPNIGAIIGANIGANLLNNRNNNSNNNNNTPIIPKGDIDSPKEDIKPAAKKGKLKETDIVDWNTLFTYWEQNKKGSKYKDDESRGRMLKKLKELTNNNLPFAKEAIFFAIDNNYQGFCNGSELYYKGKTANSFGNWDNF